MSRAPDPRWIDIACRVYSACLWLYPRELREAHGEEMRIAFRDRCREVLAGHKSAWRVFCMEIVPDLFRSAGSSQLELGVGSHQRRTFGGLILLSLLAIALLTQPLWSPTFLNTVKSLEYRWQMLKEAREYRRHHDAVVSVASALAKRGDMQSQALAAFLHRTLYDQGVSWYEFADGRGPQAFKESAEGDRATALAATLVADANDAYTLSLATQACAIEVGCNREMAIRRLVALDPDNAYGWMLAFKWAAQHQRPEDMRRALEKIGSARYYENYQGRTHRDLFAAAEWLRPGDANLLAHIARQAELSWQVDSADLMNDVLVQCSLREGENIPVHWLQLHPESRADCIHIARLLAGSTDLWRATWGWRQLTRAGEVTTKPAQETRRNLLWMYRSNVISLGQSRSSLDTDDHSWIPWQDEDWKSWAEAWKPGDGQIPSLQRWLKAHGQPSTAPADFQEQND